MKFQVFISYSSTSKNYAGLLKTWLESSGITSIWHDEDKLLAGVNLREHVMRGVRESACCIFLLDEQSSNSGWCMAEIGGFFGADKPVIIHPVKEKDSCEIPPLLAGLKIAFTPAEIIRAVKAIPQQSPLALRVTADLHVERFVGDINAAIESMVIRHVHDVVEAESAIARKANEPNKVEALIGTEAIVKAAREIIEAYVTTDSFFATSQYSSTHPISEDYLNSMAETLYMGTKPKTRGGSSGGGGSSGELEAKSRLFSEKRIEDRLIAKRAKHPWPFEVLIVGNSMIIALRGGTNNQTYEAALRVTDSEFVSKASKWFNDVVWP